MVDLSVITIIIKVIIQLIYIITIIINKGGGMKKILTGSLFSEN